MMGRQAGRQESLFYAFRLEDRVPSDHLLRRIDRVLDLSDLHGQLAGFYSHTGQPEQFLEQPDQRKPLAL